MQEIVSVSSYWIDRETLTNVSGIRNYLWKSNQIHTGELRCI